MIHVEINSNTGRFICDLTARFTRISDESETGKTTIANLIKNMQTNKVTISCKLPVLCVQSIYDMLPNHVLFIDEDIISSLGRKVISRYVEDIESYFVVISRYDFNKIPYSVDNIKKLYTCDNITNLVNVYPTMHTKAKVSECKEFYIEDSTTGKMFFDKILPGLISISGKDNLDSIPESPVNKFIVIDRCGYGSSIKTLTSRGDFEKYLHILDYESFEYFILDYLQEGFPNVECCYNVEDAYAKYLTSLLKQYSKTAGCKCFSSCNCSFSERCPYKSELLNPRKVLSKSMYGGCFQ